MNPRAPIFVLEDDPMALKQVLCGLDKHFEREVPRLKVQTASTIGEARHLLSLQQECPSLAIVDLGLPDGWGQEIIKELRQRSQAATILAHTIFDDDRNLLLALQAGANGYILKGDGPDAIQRTLALVEAGQPPLSPAMARRVLDYFVQREKIEALPTTPRELEVVRLLARGFTNSEVASALGISAHTVSSHTKNVYRKLQVSSRAELAGVLERSGIPGM